MFNKTFRHCSIFVITIFLTCGFLKPANSFSNYPEINLADIQEESIEQKSDNFQSGVLSHRMQFAHDTAENKDEVFVLPPLPWEYSALEPYIDLETMTIHHDRHHAGYVKKLNKAIATHPELKGQTVEALLQNLDNLPEDIREAVHNNGGGHANHTLFWSIMTPNGGEASGSIKEGIDATFGDIETFKAQFNAAGNSLFGSGWVWLVMNPGGLLEIITTPNQDNPLSIGYFPIIGVDVWEHAYYLKFRNKRSEYLSTWWNVVNWQVIDERFQLAKAFYHGKNSTKINRVK